MPIQVRSKKKADAEAQRKEEKASREAVKREKEARSYSNVMQVILSQSSLQTLKLLKFQLVWKEF